jgi:DNA-binding response OmpR family regulator
MPLVLVIAQDADLGSALADVLSHAGFACVVAEDEAGVQAVLRGPAPLDAAVIDVAGARSREVVVAARPLLAARGVPVVLALWAFEPPEPAEGLLRKPYDPAELVGAVRRATRKGS